MGTFKEMLKNEVVDHDTIVGALAELADAIVGGVLRTTLIQESGEAPLEVEEASAAAILATTATAAKQDILLSAIRLTNGNGLTFSCVAIQQAAAGFVLLKAKAFGKTLRLHALVGTMDADGTLRIDEATADDGTGAVGLSGIMPLANKAGAVVPFNADARACLATTAGNSLGITTVTGGFHGYAVVSTD